MSLFMSVLSDLILFCHFDFSFCVKLMQVINNTCLQNSLIFFGELIWGKRQGRGTSKLCLNWGPITTAQGASHTAQCRIQAGKKKGLRKDSQRHRKPVQDGRLKVILPILSFREAWGTAWAVLSGLVWEKFSKIVKISQSLGQGQDIAEEKQSMKSNCGGTLREGDAGDSGKALKAFRNLLPAKAGAQVRRCPRTVPFSTKLSRAMVAEIHEPTKPALEPAEPSGLCACKVLLHLNHLHY